MSPTAKMSGSLVRSAESTSTPPSGPIVRPAARRQVGVRCRADGDQDGVGVDGGPVTETQAGRGTVGGGDLLDRCTESQVDPVLAVQLGEHLGDLASERAEQRQFGGLDHGDVRAAVAGVGGHLETDPAAAHDRQRGPLRQGGVEGVGVIDGAQVVHAVGIGAGDRRPSRRRTGGQQQLVVVQRALVGQSDEMAVRVDRRHRGAEPQVDVVVAVPGGGVWR